MIFEYYGRCVISFSSFRPAKLCSTTLIVCVHLPDFAGPDIGMVES